MKISKKIDDIAIKKYGLLALPEDVRSEIFDTICAAPAKKLVVKMHDENLIYFESFNNLMLFVQNDERVWRIYSDTVLRPFFEKMALLKAIRDGDEITKDIMIGELEQYEKAIEEK